MKILLFSVYDRAAESYAPPFHAPTEAYAIRSFESAQAENDSLLGTNPQDFALFCLGEFDTEFGSLHGNATGIPRRIQTANASLGDALLRKVQ